MNNRAAKARLIGVVERRHEADHLLSNPGTAVFVHRGVARALAMVCPDGCGEVLTVNLDQRSGPAWRFYREGDSISLFPSVWRNTGCRSHFIVWQSRIYWCDWNEELIPTNQEFENLVLSKMTSQFQDYVAIAELLNVVPWSVLSACSRLKSRNLIERGVAAQQSWFRLAQHLQFGANR